VQDLADRRHSGYFRLIEVLIVLPVQLRFVKHNMQLNVEGTMRVAEETFSKDVSNDVQSP